MRGNSAPHHVQEITRLSFNPHSLTQRRTTMLQRLRQTFGDQRGVTAMEYALIAALIAVVIIGAVSMLGSSISTVFSTVANTI
ncbi:MAG: Flp family type IVb pilin [Stellaceae bacterium]